QLGFDGVDLLIRPGLHVEPSRPEGIGPAVRRLREAGLDVPMATTDLVDPGDALAEPVLRACAEAGIELVRLGYFMYDPERGYDSCFEDARRRLDVLTSHARRAGLRLALQL